LETLLHLVPVASGLALLTRTASIVMPVGIIPYFLGLAGLIALYGGLSWMIAKNEMHGQPFWTLSMASLCIVAALQLQPGAVQAWGLATLLPGGLLFLYSSRHRRLIFLPLLGWIGFSMLPFTPAWSGINLYTPFTPFLIPLLVAHGLLLAGYVRHALQMKPSLSGAEPWMWIIYPWGLILLPIMHIAIAWLSPPAAGGISGTYPSIFASWPVIIPLGLFVFILILARRGYSFPPRLGILFRRSFPTEWLYQFIWITYRFLGRSLSFISAVLEGGAGVLWALLILIMLLSLFAQVGLGG
jgi:hypothetical protein